MKKVLLHICCAPCALYPVSLIKQQGFFVEGFFFNPNIHGLDEYERRLAALETVSQKEGLTYRCPDYEPKEFFRAVNASEEPLKRCLVCWQLRLDQTAQAARQNGFDLFTSTLLASPYQDTDALIAIGQKAQQIWGIEFLYPDFKAGFWQAHKKAKQEAIYCQNYCGCIYSQIERRRKRKEKR